MNAITLFILIWADGYAGFGPGQKDALCAAMLEHKGSYALGVSARLGPIVIKPVTCELIPEKQEVKTIPAQWTVY